MAGKPEMSFVFVCFWRCLKKSIIYKQVFNIKNVLLAIHNKKGTKITDLISIHYMKSLWISNTLAMPHTFS